MELKSKHDTVIELVNKLFVYTDLQYWDKLLKEVFMEEVAFDMSSAGGGSRRTIRAAEICEIWQKAFAGLDHIHHQSGNYIVDFNGETEATIFCYAIATHYKQSATKGPVREFVGSYELRASFTDLGWRLAAFTYTLKYIHGNKELV
jgi:hypothetical protein